MCCAVVVIHLVLHSLAEFVSFFFFNDTATTEIYTLSLHDALPIFVEPLADTGTNAAGTGAGDNRMELERHLASDLFWGEDRKSTRLNSSHANISYAVFCLKKKKNDR